jgi:hypothetical protein
MRGMIAVDDVIASLPKERQKKISARGDELLPSRPQQVQSLAGGTSTSLHVF